MPSGKPLDESVKRSILRMNQVRKSAREIARTLNVSPGAVISFLDQHRAKGGSFVRDRDKS